MQYGQKYLRLAARLAVVVPFAALLQSPSPALAQVPLGAAANVAALGGSAVTCTGSMVKGDAGVDLGGAVTQTGCAISGAVYPGDTVAQQAYDDFRVAYSDLAAQPCDTYVTTALGGLTLPPGVYCVLAAATETGGVLTLDGRSTDTWTFKIGTGGTGALTGTNFTVVMAGGTPCKNNVSWWTADAATLTDSVLLGSVFSGAAITSTRGSLDGRAFATAAVTLTGTSVCSPEREPGC
jgi:Ice-binding-like